MSLVLNRPKIDLHDLERPAEPHVSTYHSENSSGRTSTYSSHEEKVISEHPGKDGVHLQLSNSQNPLLPYIPTCKLLWAYVLRSYVNHHQVSVCVASVDSNGAVSSEFEQLTLSSELSSTGSTNAVWTQAVATPRELARTVTNRGLADGSVMYIGSFKDDLSSFDIGSDPLNCISHSKGVSTL